MSGQIHTAMVMAAGHGTRMYPLTKDRSKAMVKVGGLPLVEHMLRRLEEAGISRAVVNVHAHADQLENYLTARKGKIEIVISDEREALLETGGGVVKALPLLGEDPFFICNIDAVWMQRKSQLRAMMQAWAARGPNVKSLLMLASLERTMGYNGPGDFDRAEDGALTRRRSAYAPFVYAGVEISQPENFFGYEAERFSRVKLWGPEMAGIYGHVMDGHWLHVGDPQALDMAETILSDPHSPWRVGA